MTRKLSVLLVFFILACGGLGYGWVIGNFWPDGDDIIMDDVLLPADPWSVPAQSQMVEWNEIDVTDNSHPFLINNNPQFSFGANDGDNTIGFPATSAMWLAHSNEAWAASTISPSRLASRTASFPRSDSPPNVGGSV